MKSKKHGLKLAAPSGVPKHQHNGASKKAKKKKHVVHEDGKLATGDLNSGGGGGGAASTAAATSGSGDADRKARRAFSRWLDDYGAVSAAVERHGDLEELLDANGGLVKIDNFLPQAAAEGVLRVLGDLPDDAWNETAAGRDYTHNNISHHFDSVKDADCDDLDKVFRVLSLLYPECLFTFSAARYTQGDHIEPHDDRAYTNCLMEDGQVIECSRRVAAIYYLTPGWREEWGGHLIDLETGQVHIPTFNSLIAFRIPRWHQVTSVTGNRPRFSIFGWFLEPGHLYELGLEGGGPEGSEEGGEEEEGWEEEEAAATEEAASEEQEGGSRQQQQQQEQQESAVAAVGKPQPKSDSGGGDRGRGGGGDGAKKRKKGGKPQLGGGLPALEFKKPTKKRRK